MTDKEIKEVVERTPGCILINIKRNSQWARAHFSIPDNATQFKSLELGYKIKGKLKGDPEEDAGDQVSQEIREVIFRIRTILPAGGQ